MVQVKHGIRSPLVRTSRQLTAWKKTFRDAEKTAVTKKEPMKRRMIFLIQIWFGQQRRIERPLAQTLTETRKPRETSRARGPDSLL